MTLKFILTVLLVLTVPAVNSTEKKLCGRGETCIRVTEVNNAKMTNKQTSVVTSSHEIAKRAIQLEAHPKWNSSSDTYNIEYTWTISDDEPPNNVIKEFKLTIKQVYVIDESRVPDSSIKHVTISKSNSSYTITGISPLNPSKAIHCRMSTRFLQNHNGVGGVASNQVAVVPPDLSPLEDVKLINYYLQTDTIANTITNATIYDLNLSWKKSSNVSETFYYQIWINDDLTAPDNNTDSLYAFEDINITDNVTSVYNGMLEGPLIFNDSRIIYIKIRYYYEVHTAVENFTIYSDWSRLFNISVPLPTTESIADLSTSELPFFLFSITPSTTKLMHTATAIGNSSTLIPVNSNLTTNGISDTILAVVIVAIIVFVGVCISILVIISIACGVCGCVFRKNRRQFRDILEMEDDNAIISIFHANNGQPSVVIRQKSNSQSFSYSLHTDKWEIPSEAIMCDRQLGEGCFGEVYVGYFREDFSNPALTSYLTQNKDRPYVAIKLLKSSATSAEKNDFLKEIELMKKISVGHNTRIVNMIGAVTVQEPMMLITEFVIYGDLLNYLRSLRKKSRRPNNSLYHSMKTADLQDNMFNDYFIKPDNETSMNEQYNISTFDLISFAYQISSGMEYLASLQVVHRDLACRNILVDEGNNLKITDFGLSRMINNDSMYVKTTKGKLPLKWMAIESIVDRSFTTSSDVWSFGITLWEIATLGATPYPTIGNDELLQKLIEGYRMPKPFNCPNEVYEVMLDCWKENPEDRPSFIELRKYCDSLLIKETNSSDYYLDLSDKPGACPDNQFNTQPTCNNKAHSPLADNELFNHYVDAPSKLKPFNLPLPGTSPYTMSNPVTPIDGITISPIGNLKHSSSYDANNIKTL